MVLLFSCGFANKQIVYPFGGMLDFFQPPVVCYHFQMLHVCRKAAFRFSLVGDVKPDRESAVAEARKIAESMMAEDTAKFSDLKQSKTAREWCSGVKDLDDATIRENFFLDGVGQPNAGTKVRPCGRFKRSNFLACLP